MSGPRLHCVVANPKFGVKSVPESMYDGSCMELLTVYDLRASTASIIPIGLGVTRVYMNSMFSGDAGRLHNPVGYATLVHNTAKKKSLLDCGVLYPTFYLRGIQVLNIDGVRYIPEQLRPYYESLNIELYNNYYLGE